MTNNRNRGASGEREFAKALGDEIGIPWIRRNLNQTREGGYDLITTPPDDTCPTPAQEPVLATLNRLAIEVKRSKQITPAKIRHWWAQAALQARACTHPRIPILACRQDKWPWLVILNTTLGPTGITLEGFAAWLKQPGLVAVVTGDLHEHHHPEHD